MRSVGPAVSSAVRSEDRIFGGRIQSSTTARSPTLACQGSSPATAATSAVAVEKWAYVSPREVARRPRIVGTPGAAFASVQWPWYSTSQRKPSVGLCSRYSHQVKTSSPTVRRTT